MFSKKNKKSEANPGLEFMLSKDEVIAIILESETLHARVKDIITAYSPDFEQGDDAVPVNFTMVVDRNYRWHIRCQIDAGDLQITTGTK